VVLPGGMPGTTNLEKDERVINAVKYAANKGILLAAICAAPSILGHLGLLRCKKASCYDGFEDALIGAEFIPDSVCVDGNIITACGAGAAFEFGFKILEYFTDKDTANNLKNTMRF
jgi:4-methyl-5(b-hydroxyethyl)-thiazole monophosphate biosynthesis